MPHSKRPGGYPFLVSSRLFRGGVRSVPIGIAIRYRCGVQMTGSDASLAEPC
jgi:hypothetical protein